MRLREFTMWVGDHFGVKFCIFDASNCSAQIILENSDVFFHIIDLSNAINLIYLTSKLWIQRSWSSRVSLTFLDGHDFSFWPFIKYRSPHVNALVAYAFCHLLGKRLIEAVFFYGLFMANDHLVLNSSHFWNARVWIVVRRFLHQSGHRKLGRCRICGRPSLATSIFFWLVLPTRGRTCWNATLPSIVGALHLLSFRGHIWFFQHLFQLFNPLKLHRLFGPVVLWYLVVLIQ